MRRASCATPGSTSLSPVLVQGKEEANPTNRNDFFLVYLLLLTRTKELNKRDRAAHERILKTKTRPLPFFLKPPFWKQKKRKPE